MASVSLACLPGRRFGATLQCVCSLAVQHMGVASLACVSGCACKPSRIDATTPHLLSLFMPFVFEVS